jgi:hypothetical protein
MLADSPRTGVAVAVDAMGAGDPFLWPHALGRRHDGDETSMGA